MQYGYVRVSSINQNVDRQVEEMYKLHLKDEQIYIDRQSGKDFERRNYLRLKKRLKKDDLLIVKSIDRLGRNYEMIIEEWHYITKIVSADIFVIDMPLLDTRTEGQNLVGKFISDIVLQILSFVAETERDNIHQRQAEGIRIAKAKGIHMGRPKYKLSSDFTDFANRYFRREITAKDASSHLGMALSTFLKYARYIQEQQKS